MAFPSSTGTIQSDLSDAWTSARQASGQIKTRATSVRAACAAGNVGSSLILDFITFLFSNRTTLAASAATPGIAAYAQTAINNPALVVATEFNNMMAAIDACIAWVLANFPKDVNGFLLAVTFQGDSSGRVVDRQFTPTDTAGFRTVLDTLIASIN